MYSRHRYHLALILSLCLCMCAALTGCSYDDQLHAQENLRFTIAGEVAGSAASLENIQIKIGGQTVSSDMDGKFIFKDIQPGKYTVEPVHHYWDFVPDSISVVVDDKAITGVRFSIQSPGTIAMVALAGGTFTMGTDTGYALENPAHQVTVDGFEIGKFEVTQKQWKEVTGNNPSFFRGDDKPVDTVSWHDAVNFCNQLSERSGLTPAYVINGTNVTCDFAVNGYRLPTEAEWEYACRGGTTTDRYSGNRSRQLSSGTRICFDETNLNLIGWYCENSNGTTHQVGLKEPNMFGLYDMQGNITEWCWDFRRTYSSTPVTNPTGGGTRSFRILRGGSWFDSPHEVYSAFRREYAPGKKANGVGFRVARSLP